jgi:hypothetical protein
VDFASIYDAKLTPSELKAATEDAVRKATGSSSVSMLPPQNIPVGMQISKMQGYRDAVAQDKSWKEMTDNYYANQPGVVVAKIRTIDVVGKPPSLLQQYDNYEEPKPSPILNKIEKIERVEKVQIKVPVQIKKPIKSAKTWLTERREKVPEIKNERIKEYSSKVANIYKDIDRRVNKKRKNNQYRDVEEMLEDVGSQKSVVLNKYKKKYKEEFEGGSAQSIIDDIPDKRKKSGKTREDILASYEKEVKPVPEDLDKHLTSKGRRLVQEKGTEVVKEAFEETKSKEEPSAEELIGSLN